LHMNRLLKAFGIGRSDGNPDSGLGAELAALRSEIAALRLHMERVESHHGDALTDTIGRLNHVESGHGDALVALGQRLEAMARVKDTGAQSFDQPPVRIADLDLPRGTFLGEIPGCYGQEFGTYKARGGFFDPNGNTIRYSHGDPVRFYFLSMAFDVIAREKLPGSIAELGVYQGDTAALLADFARKIDRTAYLLDTFEGFDNRDLASEDSHLSGRFAETSLEKVRERVGTANTAFVRGFFPESAVQLPAEERYCLVHIDADLYDPIRAGLDYFYPRVVDGGFIIVHDVMSMCWDGATQAVEDFLSGKPEFFIPIPDLAGTIAFRKHSRNSSQTHAG